MKMKKKQNCWGCAGLAVLAFFIIGAISGNSDTNKPTDQVITTQPVVQTESAEDKERKELDRTPQYEVAHKEQGDNGYTAILFINEPEIKDYLIVNAVKDAISKQSGQKVSLLVFASKDKGEVESAFDSTDNKASLKVISDKTRADFEKNDNNQELFYFPTGLEGEKIKLEIS